MTRRCLPWFCLGLLLASFVMYVLKTRPAHFFGHFHDDTIYFSSARALAQGEGYVLPSLPGQPFQTKYPVLYPWLLSWIWRWNPSFPANVTAALDLTMLFACWFLVAAFLFLRRLEGIGDWRGLFLVGCCAFHPMLLLLGADVLSDTLFMALAMTALVAADIAIEQPPQTRWIWLAGGLTGLAILTRSAGFPLLAGLVAAPLVRRRFRLAAAFALAGIPLVALSSLWGAAHSASPTGAAGWRQTWAYYVNYGEFWKLSVLRSDALQTVLEENLKDILLGPSALCLFPPPGGEKSIPGMLLAITLTAGIVAGIARLARRVWRPIHFMLLFTAGLLLPWNESLSQRHLLVFLPLFYAGLWTEGAHLMGMVRTTLASRRPMAEKALAGVLVAAVVAGLGLAVQQYLVGGRPGLRFTGEQRAALEPEKQEAYEWIRQHTSPETRFIASEDVNLYLYTGRQAMWPLAFTIGSFYSRDPSAMEQELAMMPDVARQIGARYWLFVAGDFYRESVSPQVRERIAAWRKALPVVYRTSHNRAEVHDLACVIEPERERCRTIAAALSLQPRDDGAASRNPPWAQHPSAASAF